MHYIFKGVIPVLSELQLVVKLFCNCRYDQPHARVTRLHGLNISTELPARIGRDEETCSQTNVSGIKGPGHLPSFLYSPQQCSSMAQTPAQTLTSYCKLPNINNQVGAVSGLLKGLCN